MGWGGDHAHRCARVERRAVAEREYSAFLSRCWRYIVSTTRPAAGRLVPDASAPSIFVMRWCWERSLRSGILRRVDLWGRSPSSNILMGGVRCLLASSSSRIRTACGLRLDIGAMSRGWLSCLLRSLLPSSSLLSLSLYPLLHLPHSHIPLLSLPLHIRPIIYVAELALQNRMRESLDLFESVINSRWFLRTSVILFLTKIDVLKRKAAEDPPWPLLPGIHRRQRFPESREVHPMEVHAGESSEANGVSARHPSQQHKEHSARLHCRQGDDPTECAQGLGNRIAPVLLKDEEPTRGS
ncbi:hypothetical protein B0H14DRAFT_32945 [Mycena olivaceomarginata]|nr:hypothetical protein B0H14DRAFT_32945 [Mycena olivaceomarginata]